MNDDVSLKLNGVTVSGWTSVRITRGIERCPSDFEIELTERYPGEFSTLTVVPGDPCQVLAGIDVVVTGYIDRYIPSIDPRGHSITIQGRGKCQDLVDCAAAWKGGQIPTTTAFQIATKLAAPFGIAVMEQPGVDSTIQQLGVFNLILGETVWEIVERVCRNAGVLCYEDNLGNLILSYTGTTSAASGFQQGVNVKSASYTLSADQRYSTYTAVRLSFDGFSLLMGGNVINVYTDPQVLRYRPHIVVAEGGPGCDTIANRRAIWEKNRRIGRSYMVHFVTDGWRDSAGALYVPNTLALVDLPALKISKQIWLIGEITYKRDEKGTTAEVTMMPPDAFLPQPELIGPAFSFGS